MSKEASATYKVTILDAVFKACKVKVDSANLGNHTNAILKSPARHSYLKTDVKMTTHLSDKTSELLGRCLKRETALKSVYNFHKQSAVNENYLDNPFNFEHFDLSEIGLYVNGEPTSVVP